MSTYKENQAVNSYNQRMQDNLKSFENHINEDLREKHTEEECQLLQPLVQLVTRYVIYSGLYDDLTFHLEEPEDIREVAKHARGYFIEASFNVLHSEEPISQKMERDLIEFAFFSLEAAAIKHLEILKSEEKPEEKPEEKTEEKPEITDDDILFGDYEEFMSQ